MRSAVIAGVVGVAVAANCATPSGIDQQPAPTGGASVASGASGASGAAGSSGAAGASGSSGAAGSSGSGGGSSGAPDSGASNGGGGTAGSSGSSGSSTGGGPSGGAPPTDASGDQASTGGAPPIEGPRCDWIPECRARHEKCTFEPPPDAGPDGGSGMYTYDIPAGEHLILQCRGCHWVTVYTCGPRQVIVAPDGVNASCYLAITGDCTRAGKIVTDYCRECWWSPDASP